MVHHAVPFDPELQQPLFPKEAACPPEVRVMEEGLARLAMEHHATSEKPYIIYDAENPVPEPSFCGPGFVSFSVRKHEMLLVHSHLSWEAQAAGMLKALGTPLRRPQLERIHGKPRKGFLFLNSTSTKNATE